jgi:hypothetical protein
VTATEPEAIVPDAVLDAYVTNAVGEEGAPERRAKVAETPPDRAAVLPQPDGPDDTSAWGSSGTAMSIFLLPSLGRRRDDRAGDPETRYTTEESAWIDGADDEADPGFATWRRNSAGMVVSATPVLADNVELRCSTAAVEEPLPEEIAAEVEAEEEDAAGAGVAELLREKADLWGAWPGDLGVL